MAKKKRKPSAPPVRAAGESSGAGRPAEFPAGRADRKGFGLTALCAFALVVAWLGALGGVGAGNTDIRALFTVDTLHSWMVFRDAFLLEGYPASGWRHGVSLFYFPEYAVLWPLYALGLDFRAAMLAMTLVYAATSAAGWALACDALFGRDSVRRALVVLLHAPPFLILAWAHSDIYSLQLRVVFHYGAWTLVPWLLWLFIRALESSPPRGRDSGRRGDSAAWKNLAAAAVLLALTAASDLVIVPWFAAPALFSLLCLCALGKMSGREFVPFALAVAFGIAGGLVLKDLPDFPPHRDTETFLSLNLSRTLPAIGRMLSVFGDFAARNPFSALAWCAFAGIALWRLSLLRKRPRAKNPAAREWLGVPDSRAHWFAALFAPAAAVSAVGAVAATGNFVAPYFDGDLSPGFRYFGPLFFFPLFVGWALLPLGKNRPFRGRAGPVVAACAVAAVLIGAPRAAAIDRENLDPFSAPFHRCFAENARRLGWKGGVATGFFALPLAANPSAEVERILPVGALRRGAGDSFMYVDWTVFSRHWFNGEFQFALVNDHRGRVSWDVPTPAHPACPPEAREPCMPPGHGALFLDDAAARGAFGDPAEIVECGGLAFYHYDPPLRFDFSGMDNPDFARAGRMF